MSRQLNWIEIQLGCLESSKYISFYSVFGRNRPIETIDGYDGTVHRGPFQLSRSRLMLVSTSCALITHVHSARRNRRLVWYDEFLLIMYILLVCRARAFLVYLVL